MVNRTGLRCWRLGACLAALQSAASAAAAQPAEPVNTAHFEIDEFRVEGNTTVPTIDIERAVKAFLGPGKTAQDIENARAALEKLYADKGFPTVSAEIPRQRLNGDGVVTLKVTERTVGRLRVTGSRYFDQYDIRAGAPSVAEGRVPNIAKLQRDVLALNQRADRSITPALRAGLAPDTVDVDLQVADTWPLHGSLELSNRYSQATKPLRALASLSYDNLWQRGDSATLSYQIAPQREGDVNVISGSYLFHIPGSDLSLLGSYVHSGSNVTTLGSTNVVGRGTIAGIRLVVPLGTDESFTHNLSLGADYKKLTELDRTGTLTQTSSGSPLASSVTTVTSAPITYYPFTASYEATWFETDATQTNLSLGVTTTVRGLGGAQDKFDYKRFGASPNFIYLRGDLARTQPLPYGMQAYGHLTGLLSGEPLVSSEQFTLGGLDSVRGYFESEALGDEGAALQLELRSPSFASDIDQNIDDLRFFAFFDAGLATIHNALPNQTTYSSLRSTGFGVRLRLLEYLNTEIADAVTLGNGPDTKARTNRILFRVYGEF